MPLRVVGCVRCWTRYCDATCQHDHWRRGHKQICKRIHRGGNAEQYNADKKYKEAVAVAVDSTYSLDLYFATAALPASPRSSSMRPSNSSPTSLVRTAKSSVDNTQIRAVPRAILKLS